MLAELPMIGACLAGKADAAWGDEDEQAMPLVDDVEELTDAPVLLGHTIEVRYLLPAQAP